MFGVRGFTLAFTCVAAIFVAALPLHAQGGPPLLTDDPGTPGSNNWEINVGLTAERHPDERIFNAPVIDLNYGAGHRVQLNFQVPWIIRGTDNGPTQQGLGNSQAAVKWRFFDDQKHTLAISTYPRVVFNNPNHTVRRGLDTKGTDFLLPLEITKHVGPLDVNFEVGHWFTQYGPDTWITGVAAGRQISSRVELLGEFYNEHDAGIGDHSTTFDFGGRCKLNSYLVLLFMAGRSFNGPETGEPQLIGYLGIQFVLEHKKSESTTPMPPTPLLTESLR